ncbi:MAG: helix-turn-helix domain-containing protein [Candidatus Melainabacteria bacterium]|nr:helix-turn-helix domain-containing protein [Candidatus Melainabacteria bacterium]
MQIDFAQLNKNSESETLEFKESFDSKALETIGAFANTNGGIILIGVRDDGRVLGITVGDTTLEDWAQRMQSKIQPRFLPSVVPCVYNGRTVIAITVERSDNPISVDGRYIKRVGRTNQIMSPEEVRQRLFASSTSGWDSRIEDRATIADLDPEAIQLFIDRLNKLGRRPVPEGEDVLSTLEKLELLEKGIPTRAAILLLGKEPKRFYPSAFIKVGRFKSETMIVDDKEFDGPLFKQIDEALSWFLDRLERKFIIGKSNLSGSHRISGSFAEREEVWEYPLPALREAVANAVCHRIYKTGVSINIRLYDDHLEIWNPGSLPVELRPEDLFRPHNSYAPNRLIAECFYNTGIIERWGTGTIRIVEALSEQGLAPPQFDVSISGTFKLVLSPIGTYGERRLREQGLNDRQIKAIQYLQSNKSLTNAEYQSLFGASKPTSTRDLSQLVEKGLILREGKTGKGTIYRLAEG